MVIVENVIGYVISRRNRSAIIGTMHYAVLPKRASSVTLPFVRVVCCIACQQIRSVLSFEVSTNLFNRIFLSSACFSAALCSIAKKDEK